MPVSGNKHIILWESKWSDWKGLNGKDTPLQGTPNQNLACFVCYLKIANTFFNGMSFLKQIVLQKLKNGKISVGHTVPELLVKTCQILFCRGRISQRATRVHLDSPRWSFCKSLWILLYSVCVKHLTVCESLTGILWIHLRESLREWTLGLSPKF